MSELEKLEGLSESVKQYILLNYEILKLETIRKTSEIGSSLLGYLALGMAIFFLLFTLSIGAGFYLSALLGDSFSGFGIVAGFYLLITIIVLIGRKKLIEKPIRDKIIKDSLDNKKV